MKRARGPSRKRKVDFSSQVFSLSQAKTYLGRLLSSASAGKVVYILRRQQRFALQEVRPIDPIPMRPPGYFSGSYSKGDAQRENRLAKDSVVRAPRDLE